MKIHEYQAREIFRKFGIPVSKGEVATTPDEAFKIASEIGVPVVVKAQVHVGGRGKAGGVKFGNTPEEARDVASKILGMNLKGFIVKKVLVAEKVEYMSESYMGITVDRKSKNPIVLVSSEGGVEIEEVAKNNPSAINRLEIDPLLGLLPNQGRELGFKIYPDSEIALKAGKILEKLYRVFVETDASLCEINPFVLNKNREVLAIDAKMNIDDNGLFRRQEIFSLRDKDEETPNEVKAREKGLSYIALEGNIGCVVNGAGLAMATMDMVKLYGGEPANFLDIGGSSSPEKVTTAMEIILQDKKVKAILFNIFGGITRCDDVALGIVDSLSKMKIDIPIVVRLTGTNEEKARDILRKTSLIPVSSMAEGVKRVCEIVREMK